MLTLSNWPSRLELLKLRQSLQLQKEQREFALLQQQEAERLRVQSELMASVQKDLQTYKRAEIPEAMRAGKQFDWYFNFFLVKYFFALFIVFCVLHLQRVSDEVVKVS